MHLREVWRDYQNLALAREDVRDGRGELVQVDHRSYEQQGIDREATEHEGHVATAIRRRGGESDLVAGNDNVRQRNAAKDQLTQQIEDSREAIAEELTAIHRTPAEDHVKYKFHDDETVQEILAEQDAERRGFATMGRASLSPRVFRPGDSRKLAAFNAGSSTDAETGGGAESGRPRDLLNTDLLESDRLESDLRPTRPWRWRGLDAFNQEMAAPDEEQKKEREGGGDRQFANGNELLDTDPSTDEYERQRSIAPIIRR